MEAGRDHSTSPGDAAVVAEEERLLARVREAVDRAANATTRGDPQRHLRSLRDQALSASDDDRPALVAELWRTRATAQHARPQRLPDLQVPYFAHMQLETERGVRDVLLGYRTFIDARHRVTIVDWREAPIAQIFFEYREGDDYEEEISGRLSCGVLRQRRVLAFDGGELVQITTPEGVLRRERGGAWDREAEIMPTLAGADEGEPANRILGTGQAGKRLPVVSSLLDPTQYRALTRDAREPLLILGGAGCGKTTVALHRLAYLAYRDPDRFPLSKLAVLVPEEGLLRLTRALLAELELSAIPVQTVDRWMVEHARKLFRGLPKRLAQQTPAAVIRIKRHAALTARLPDVARERGLASAIRLDRELGAQGALRRRYEESPIEFPLGRLEDAMRAAALPIADEQAQPIFEAERERLLDWRADREQLFGDRAVLERVIAESQGELNPGVIERLIEHTRIQDSQTTEQRYAHVSADRLKSVDGRSIDAGTPDEDAGSIDVEDFALLIELHRLKTGRSGSAKRQRLRWRHVVVDEAQELAHVELQVIGAWVEEDGAVTVAGDAAQQIDPNQGFAGWNSVMESLGVVGSESVTLETSYRCTGPIARFAHQILGPLAPDQPPLAEKAGVPVAFSHVNNEMHASLFLGEALADLVQREPQARVGVVTRDEERARRLHGALSRSVPHRLVLDGSFELRPGVEVSCVAQVRGLEFDYVVVPDASAGAYPDDPLSRRMLHVASSRAIHQLWIISVGERSPLLADIDINPGPSPSA